MEGGQPWNEAGGSPAGLSARHRAQAMRVTVAVFPWWVVSVLTVTQSWGMAGGWSGPVAKVLPQLGQVLHRGTSMEVHALALPHLQR